ENYFGSGPAFCLHMRNHEIRHIFAWTLLLNVFLARVLYPHRPFCRYVTVHLNFVHISGDWRFDRSHSTPCLLTAPFFLAQTPMTLEFDGVHRSSGCLFSSRGLSQLLSSQFDA